LPTHDLHFALGLEYDGSCFHGWQRQDGQRSVQQVLEEALSQVADAPIRVAAAGRTDAGVHATQQIVSFTTTAVRPIEGWIRGLNSLTPAGLSVRWAVPVRADFHARYSATARRYFYVILESERVPAIGRELVAWSRPGLADAQMYAAARALLGEHDFSTFRAAACQSKTPYRCIFAIDVRRFDDLVVIDITANAFLHHMVRNIAAALLQVGRAERTPAWIAEVLRKRNRALIGPTAPPNGLYLVDVSYGADIVFPRWRAPAILRAIGEVW
jgi:tRNA pseudouridine38-40 synthase